MSEERPNESPDSDNATSGQAARRKFLQTSGKAAIAAPAAVLLLSMASKTQAISIYTDSSNLP